MSSKKGVCITPLVTGIFLRSVIPSTPTNRSFVVDRHQFRRRRCRYTRRYWILLERREFSAETDESSDRSVPILAGLALLSFTVGVVVAAV